MDPLTDVLTTAMVSAFLLGMRREFDRAEARGVKIGTVSDTDVVKVAK